MELNMTKIMMNPADVKVIQEIIEENNITGNFELIHNNGGIGYSIDLIYEADIKNRNAKITIPVCGAENW
jgi:hypothetical protein